MTSPAVFAPAARNAIRDAVIWIAADSPDAARRFRTALTDAARLIGGRPGIGRRHPVLLGKRYRLWSLAGFPYLLVYDPDTQPPQILRVLHTARDLPPLLGDLPR